VDTIRQLQPSQAARLIPTESVAQRSLERISIQVENMLAGQRVDIGAGHRRAVFGRATARKPCLDDIGTHGGVDTAKWVSESLDFAAAQRATCNPAIGDLADPG
jgi:hypothetical protein